jgi:DNA polymerase-3 subunit beta
MKFITTQEHITSAVDAASRIAKKHTSLPILENILVEAKEGEVCISGTNLEIGIQKRFPAKVEVVGSVAVPAKLFMGFLSHIPKENTISFEVKDSAILVSSGRYSAKFVGPGTEEFPLLPKPNNEENSTTFQIPIGVFRVAMAQSMVCVAPNDVRLEFSGVFCSFSDTTLTLAATDGFRLSESAILDVVRLEGVDGEKNAIFPLRSVSEVLHSLSKESQDGTFRIVMESGQVFFFLQDGTVIVSQTIRGNFPDYKQIIPERYSTVLDVDTKECLRAVKLAGVFGSSGVSEVVFRVKTQENKVELESRGSGSGANISTLDLEYCQGEDIEIVFNPKYVADGLSCISDVMCRMAFSGESSPTVLGNPSKDDNREFAEGMRYIVMPIKK